MQKEVQHVHRVVYSAYCAVCRVQSIVCSVVCGMCYVHCAVRSVLCVLCSVQRSVCSVLCSFNGSLGQGDDQRYDEINLPL